MKKNLLVFIYKGLDMVEKPFKPDGEGVAKK